MFMKTFSVIMICPLWKIGHTFISRLLADQPVCWV